jgi:hypothetical protein
MLGTSRLPAVGVFLVGVMLGASVCGAGRPSRTEIDATTWSGRLDAETPFQAPESHRQQPGERHPENHRIGR